MTKLAGTLPGGDANGLIRIARKLIDTPNEIHVVVALVDCKSTTTDNDTGETIPTARIRRLEVVLDMDREVAAKMLRRALEERTGQTVLPFDLEEDLRAVYGGVDPDTGEILGDE